MTGKPVVSRPVIASEAKQSGEKTLPKQVRKICHPETTKNQAAKQRRFCFVQDLTNLAQHYYRERF